MCFIDNIVWNNKMVEYWLECFKMKKVWYLDFWLIYIIGIVMEFIYSNLFILLGLFIDIG